MSFLKYAQFEVISAEVATNKIFLLKNAHRHEFEYTPELGYLYVRSRAISSRTNDNYDRFPAHSIKEAWRTFIGKPVFVNHNNDNHKRARGVCIDAALHEDFAPDGSPDTWVEVLMQIDAVHFPKLAEAVVKGWIDRTSMGTEVALSTCSYCGNQAENPAQYCSHIPGMKGQRITRTTASGTKESVLVTEICEGLSFFENSLLVEAPADPTAYMFGVDSSTMDKTAAQRSRQQDYGTCRLCGQDKDRPICGNPDCSSNALQVIHAGVDHEDDVACCDGFIPEGAHIVVAPDGSVYHPDCARSNGFAVTDCDYCKTGGKIWDWWSGGPHEPKVRTCGLPGCTEERDEGSRLCHWHQWEKDSYRAPTPYLAKTASLNPLADITDFEVIEAEAILAAVDGIGACGAHNCSCSQYRFKSKQGVYNTCECGHSQNVHASPEGTVQAVPKPRKQMFGKTAAEEISTEALQRAAASKVYFHKTYSGVSYQATAESATFECKPHMWLPEYVIEDHAEHIVGRAKTARAALSILMRKADAVARISSLKTAGWIGGTEDDEYHTFEVQGVGEAQVSMDIVGADSHHSGNWLYDVFRYDDLPYRLRGMSLTLPAAKMVCEEYIAGGQMSLFGSKTAYLGLCESCGYLGPDTEDYRTSDGHVGEDTYKTLCPNCAMDFMGEHYQMSQITGFGSRKQGLGEKTAPQQVDTLRMEACPVCSDPDSFNGTQCAVCGFIKPPDLFDDPDLDRAKQVDLRGGDADGAADPSQPTSELECDSCGATFPLAAKTAPPSTTGTTPTPELQSISALPNAVPKPKPTGKPNPFAKKDDDDDPKKKKSLPPWLKKDDDGDKDSQPVEDKGKVPDPAPLPKNSDPNAVDPDADPKAVQPDPDAEDPAEPDPNAPLAAGDTCPTCGAGTLNEIPIETDAQAMPSSGDQAGDGGADLAPDPNAVDPDADPGVGKKDPNQPTDPKDEAALPDKKAPPVAPDDEAEAPEQDKAPTDDAVPDDGDDKDDDGKKKKKLPPWMKKKTSHRARTHLEGVRVKMANPAQVNRNRLIEALRAQQFQIRTQAERNTIQARAMLTLAEAAGIAGHPHFAALRQVVADDPNGPLPSDDTALAAPDAKDDPTNIGAAPSSANTGVTPAGVTDVSNTNVALPTEPFGDLQDVTAPGSDIDPPKGDAAHVDTDVRVGTPSTESFPDNSGWKSSSREDPHVRLMASLRLAKMRTAAGLGGGTEEMSLGQAISDDPNLSLATIQHEITMLSALSKVKFPAGKTAAARSLVPQRAPEVTRSVPSLTTQASGETSSPNGVDPLADSLI